MESDLVRFLAVVAFALMVAPVLAQPIPGAPNPIPPPPRPLVGPKLPGSPAKLDTFGDKVLRCMHHGGSSGVPAGQIGRYTRQCVNSR
jgi:hypothetical protein